MSQSMESMKEILRLTAIDGCSSNEEETIVISLYEPLGTISIRKAIMKADPVTPSRKTKRRNAVCDCGSGKKFKHCCLKEQPND